MKVVIEGFKKEVPLKMVLKQDKQYGGRSQERSFLFRQKYIEIQSLGICKRKEIIAFHRIMGYEGKKK